MKLKTQWRIASVLFFIMVMVYVKLKADICTIGEIIGFAFVISTPIGILLWKYKSKLNSKIFKGFAALSIPVGLFSGDGFTQDPLSENISVHSSWHF